MVTVFSEMEHDMGCRDHYVLRCKCPTPNWTGNFLFENLRVLHGTKTHVHIHVYFILSFRHHVIMDCMMGERTGWCGRHGPPGKR